MSHDDNESDVAPAATATSGGARRILIVDDNVDAAETLGMLLELSGHEIRTAHTGPDAVTAVREYAPEVVFLDIGLPGMDGYEVARTVRADESREPARGRIVLVALTGWGTAADQLKSRDAGFDVHLTKPIQLSVIEGVLARFGTPEPT